MTKLIAILNVVAWSGFWAFGYIALTAGAGSGNTIVAGAFALIGAGVGVWAYMMLVRNARATGFEQVHRRAEIQGAGPVNAEAAEGEA